MFLSCCLSMQEDPSLTQAWQKTVKVAVTGASGQIANHLLFMVRVCVEGLMALGASLALASMCCDQGNSSTVSTRLPETLGCLLHGYSL